MQQAGIHMIDFSASQLIQHVYISGGLTYSLVSGSGIEKQGYFVALPDQGLQVNAPIFFGVKVAKF